MDYVNDLIKQVDYFLKNFYFDNDLIPVEKIKSNYNHKNNLIQLNKKEGQIKKTLIGMLGINNLRNMYILLRGYMLNFNIAIANEENFYYSFADPSTFYFVNYNKDWKNDKDKISIFRFDDFDNTSFLEIRLVDYENFKYQYVDNIHVDTSIAINFEELLSSYFFNVSYELFKGKKSYMFKQDLLFKIDSVTPNLVIMNFNQLEDYKSIIKENTKLNYALMRIRGDVVDQ